MPVTKSDKTIVRKNSTGSEFQRRRVNLIEGSNVTLTVADDSANNEVDVTIAATGGSGSPGGSDTQVQFNDGGSFAGDSALVWNKTDNRLGIGGTPTEILHIQKGTGEFTTIRFDSGTTHGYFYAYDTDNAVNIGSTSDSKVRLNRNNTTRAEIGYTADVSIHTQNPTGDRTIVEIKAPSGSPEEATLTTSLDYGSGNKEFVDWTIEDYAGLDHKASINIAKSGTGTLVPFIIRYWDTDLGVVATYGKTYFTITPDTEVVINDDSMDVNFRVESDGNANMLFVDAGNNRVGVGTNAPDELLHLDSGGDYTTMRFDANTDEGFFYADGAFHFIVAGSKSATPFWLVYNATERVALNATENVINDNSADIDTRIEGNTDANLVFVDAGNDRVGIGMNNPSEKLNVTGNILATGTVLGSNLSGTNTGDEPTASASAEGVVELATIAETTTGTDATRAITPDGLAGSDYGKRVVGVLVSDPQGSAITTGDGKAFVRIPAEMNGWNLVGVAMAVTTVSSSGIPTVQLRRSRRASATTRTDADMLSTKLTVDASEFDSVDAAAAAVIDTTNDDVNTGDGIYIDIDVAGTGTKGLFVSMTFQLP